MEDPGPGIRGVPVFVSETCFLRSIQDGVEGQQLRGSQTGGLPGLQPLGLRSLFLLRRAADLALCFARVGAFMPEKARRMPEHARGAKGDEKDACGVVMWHVYPHEGHAV